MKRSLEKILTTHAGSLPWGDPLAEGAEDYENRLRQSVEGVLAQQRSAGLDIVNEGEYTKGGDWLSFMDGRLGGCEARPDVDGKMFTTLGKDREEFAEFYKYATEKGTLFYLPNNQIATARITWFCTGPMSYIGEAALKREIVS